MLHTSVVADRIARARASMDRSGVDVLLVSVGPDLPYLVGYEAMPLERLTMLVVPRSGEVTLVIPRLEAPRVTEHPGVFTLLPWGETDDPVAIVASLVDRPQVVAVGDTMWARFLVELLAHWPSAKYVRSVVIMNDLRMRKDAAEVAALQAAGAAIDRVMVQVQSGAIALVGRTEAEVSDDVSRRIIAEGHQKVNFAIVAAGENAASPHHHPGDRLIRHGDLVLFDIGGTMNGYCSDITRCVHLGPVPADIAAAYEVLHASHAAGVSAGTVGTACQDVDRAARRVMVDGGHGDHFIHRTGHGIGMEEHEDPYMVEGNTLPIEAGHAFSIEPGIYVAGRWGMRLEDIVVATDAGPLAMTTCDHSLVVLD